MNELDSMTEDTMSEIRERDYQNTLNRAPDANDVRDIRELKSRGYEISAVATAMELRKRTVKEVWKTI
jgi:uncharacterized protein (UPF0335 family)